MSVLTPVLGAQVPMNLVIIGVIIVIFVAVGLVAWWQSNRGPLPGQPPYGPDESPPEPRRGAAAGDPGGSSSGEAAGGSTSEGGDDEG